MKILLKQGDPAVQQAYDAYLEFNQNEELRQLEDAREQFHETNWYGLHDTVGRILLGCAGCCSRSPKYYRHPG